MRLLVRMRWKSWLLQEAPVFGLERLFEVLPVIQPIAVTTLKTTPVMGSFSGVLRIRTSHPATNVNVALQPK